MHEGARIRQTPDVRARPLSDHAGIWRERKSGKNGRLWHRNVIGKSWSVIASRLAHDEKILAAIHEEDQKRIRASAPRAIQALHNLIEDPTAKDHARGIAMVLDRVHPVETQHTVKVEHEAATSMRATAEVFARIMELAARAKVAPMIDVTPEKVAS